jgi:hypothetical protein
METEILVWDLFFVRGFNVMFRVALTALELLQAELLKLSGYSEVVAVLSSFCNQKISRAVLLEHLAKGLDSS